MKRIVPNAGRELLVAWLTFVGCSMLSGCLVAPRLHPRAERPTDMPAADATAGASRAARLSVAGAGQPGRSDGAALPNTPRLFLPRYAATSDVRVAYEVGPSTQPRRVELWVHPVGQDVPPVLTTDGDGESPATLRLEDGVYDVALRLGDRDARSSPPQFGERQPDETAADRGRIIVDTESPTARIVSARVLEGLPYRARLGIEARDHGPSGLARIEIHARHESEGAFRRIVDVAPRGVVEVELGESEGRVDLFAVARDRAGNFMDLPSDDARAQARVSLGVPQFEVQILDFAPGKVLAGGSQQYVFLRTIAHRADSEPVSMSLAYSTGDGGAWRTIVEKSPFTTRYLWRVPHVTAAECRLRIESEDRRGRRAVFVSKRAFAIDSEPPRARVVEASALGAGKVLVRVEAPHESPAGLDDLRLYHRQVDGEADWEPVEIPGEGKGLSRVHVVQLPRGRIALKAVGRDRAGNSDPTPERDTEPDAHVDVDPAAASVLVLENFHGGRFRGGEPRYVFWSYRGPPSILTAAPFHVELSVDGGSSWRAVEGGEGLDASTRRLRWILPELQGRATLLRVRAELRGGHDLAARSREPFLVETRPPSVLLVGPQASASHRTRIRFRARSVPPAGKLDPPRAGAASTPLVDGPAGEGVPLSKVECFASRLPDGEWFLAGQWRADAPVWSVEDEIELTLEHGAYRLALVVTDVLGIASSPGGQSDGSGGTLIVDTLRPHLRVRMGDARDLYVRGEEIGVDIRAEDDHLPPMPVELYLRGKGVDGELQETLLESRFPATGRYVLRVPDTSGTYTLRVRVADLAGNESEFERSLFVMPPQPRVRLTTFAEPTTVPGGEPAEIRWETRYVSYRGPTVSIRLSRDGGLTWTLLAEGLENTGVFVWEVPAEDFQNGRLRVEVVGPKGQLDSAESAPLIVSTRIPTVTITGIVQARQNPVDRAAKGRVEEGGKEERSPGSGSADAP